MSNVPFSYTRGPSGESLVIMGSRGTRPIADSHANFGALKNLLVEGTEDEARVYELCDAAATISQTLSRLSDRVTLKGDSVYFDGDEMDSMLTQHIVAMLRNNDQNYKGYVKFLENVQQNPSQASKDAVFAFLRKCGLQITDKGTFIGYKAVASDGRSFSSGNEDVSITHADGTVEVVRGRIPNRVGDVIEMARSLVDDNTGVSCSRGLHIGTHNYANNWGVSDGMFLTVEVNPRDVVSVPHSDAEKLRACRYTVIEINEKRVKYEGTSYGAFDSQPEMDDYDYPDDGWDDPSDPWDYPYPDDEADQAAQDEADNEPLADWEKALLGESEPEDRETPNLDKTLHENDGWQRVNPAPSESPGAQFLSAARKWLTGH